VLDDPSVGCGEPRVKKRLRKKKHLGEFRELGFELSGALQPGVSNDDINAFVDRLIGVIETRSLLFGGGVGGDDNFGGFVTRDGRGSATEDDRAALREFLSSERQFTRFDVGALRDAWYGWD